MGLDFKAIRAIARRDLRTYLSNPIGYVFLTLFVLVAAGVAFMLPGFFSRNLADLASLNALMPVILAFFVPALTMGTWADERRNGTDELLLTMPVRDPEVVLGKYLGVLGLFTISLLFSLSNVVVLTFLGEPDWGLMAATYAGYWLTGALFCAVGLVASMFTRYSVIAFIFGLLGCSALVGAGHPAVPSWMSGVIGATVVGMLLALTWTVVRGEGKDAGVVGLVGGLIGLVAWRTLWTSAESGGEADAVDVAGTPAGDASADVVDVLNQKNVFEELFSQLGVSDYLVGFGQGVVQLGDILYFATGMVLALYLASFMLGRRHW
jgi:ABC-2 type transport system permease protein